MSKTVKKIEKVEMPDISASALDKFQQKQNEFNKAREAYREELEAERKKLLDQLKAYDDALAKITGKPVEKSERRDRSVNLAAFEKAVEWLKTVKGTFRPKDVFNQIKAAGIANFTKLSVFKKLEDRGCVKKEKDRGVYSVGKLQ